MDVFNSIYELKKEYEKTTHYPQFPAQFKGLITEEKWERAKKIETEIITLGIDSLYKSLQEAREQKRENTTQYGRNLSSVAIPNLIKAIKAYLDAAAQGKAGRRPTAVRYMQQLPVEILAVLTIQTIMQHVTGVEPLNKVAINIGENIEDEIRRTSLKKVDKKSHKWAVERTKKSTHARHKRNIFKNISLKAGVDEFTVPRTDRIHVGIKLIELFIEATGLVELKEMAVQKGFAYFLTPSQACLSWISKRMEFCAVLNPKYLPTIVPPKPWHRPFGGGYWSKDIKGRVMIKTRYKGYLDELDARREDMPDLYKSINAIQETAWKVNSEVLDIANEVWDNFAHNKNVAGLPQREPLEIPLCPICGAGLGYAVLHEKREKHNCFDTCDPDVLKEWRQATSVVWDNQVALNSQRFSTAKILYLADKFKDEETIYYPHQLDFRGRAYPMASYLTPQGTDLAKGLLSFAQGKALGASGAKWLAIHVANLWGADKVSFDKRCGWTETHIKEIQESAENPLDFHWWMDADKPFQFLAACKEYAGYIEQGEKFVSHLPISLDGTCNGLQIFSLMLRDEEGGRATNLVPSTKPQDIYGIVAGKTITKLEHLAKMGVVRTREIEKECGKTEIQAICDEKRVAKLMLHIGITRDTTKRQVMVVPYGGTISSCREYTWEYVKGCVGKDVSILAQAGGWSSLWHYSRVLADVIWEAIDETVESANSAMKYLQSLASVASSKDLPIYWTTPVGFPVLQAYKNTKEHRIKTELFGAVYRPRIATYTETLNKAKQRLGMSPNFIHSLDAAALHYTVARGAEQGLGSFAMIHDDYGVHACDTNLLAKLIRNSFVDLFGGEENLLEKLKQEVLEQTDTSEDDKGVLDVPLQGYLDVETVRDSLYFFA